MQLHSKAFSLSCGIISGFSVFLVGILGSLGIGTSFVESLSGLYPGFTASLLGSVVGSIWAFIDGLILGGIFSWLYNRLSRAL